MLNEIIKSKKKQKEKIILLAKAICKDKKLIVPLLEIFANASDSEKGLCVESLEYITKDHPEYIKPYLDIIFQNINYKAPRVKWECSRVIGNIAPKFPDKIAQAIPSLLVNTEDKGTVVRWSAAFALTEIAKNDSKTQKKLLEEFELILKKENNNGVKNVYLKALKQIKT